MDPKTSSLRESYDRLAQPYADRAGCTAFYAIVHFDTAELRRAVPELARVLRSGGLLLLAFHEGVEQIHRDELFGVAVDLDFVFWETTSVERELADAGFAIEARLERAPYEGHEHPSRRTYLFARRRA